MTRHLLVIGGQRCGTTYLHAMLEAHPQVAMARPARPEPKVFLSADAVAHGLDWYRDTYFAHDPGASLLGEKSTSYLEYATAARRAASMLGHAHIVALLREPRDRALSNWQFSTAEGFEERPAEQALAENLRQARRWDPAATSSSPYAYLERGRYADYLRPWFQEFGAGVHVRFYEEVVGNPGAVAELYDTLGVDSRIRPPGLDRHINASRDHAPALPHELDRRLADYFADSNRRLSELLGRPLPWPETSGSRTSD